MTKIVFYQLQTDNTEARLLFICKLLTKIWRQALKIYVYDNIPANNKHLSDLLWNFSEYRFIPHSLTSDSAPINLGEDERFTLHNDVIINLGENIPVHYSRFVKVLEIVDNQPQIKKNSREHYRYFKDRGYPIEHHQIKYG